MVVQTLRPDAELVWDDEAQARRARRRMDDVCDERVRTLETIDANRKVVVTGGAGSGKTRLAMSWARRAVARGSRVLLTCYNDPLGEHLVTRRLEPSGGARGERSSRVSAGSTAHASAGYPEHC